MGCCNTPGLMPVPEAISTILRQVQPISEIETVSLTDALNRICADDIISPIHVPPFANSAMDGYAVRVEDFSNYSHFKVIGKAFAGEPFDGECGAGESIRIMTGAKIPQGANAVIMQEEASETQNDVIFQQIPHLSQNIRPIGDDILKGICVIKKGTQLTAREIPLLATLGISTLPVYRKPRVAFFSTGDELRGVGETLSEGQIYDSNRYTIHAMLKKMHCQVIDLGVAPDCPLAIKLKFDQAAASADLVITSGGVSVGEADFTKDILRESGSVGFWKLAIKPGKPFAFGKINQALFCGLPGNPVSVLVTLYVLVQPLIAKLSGHEHWQPVPHLSAMAKSRFKKSPGRTDFQRGIASLDEQGQLQVETTGNQGSGSFSSLSIANCFVVLEQDRGSVEEGESVQISLFDAILN